MYAMMAPWINPPMNAIMGIKIIAPIPNMILIHGCTTVDVPPEKLVIIVLKAPAKNTPQNIPIISPITPQMHAIIKANDFTGIF